jgi:hypothetical protein
VAGFLPVGSFPVASITTTVVAADDNNVFASAPTLLTFQGFLPTIVNDPEMQVEQYGFYISGVGTAEVQVEQYLTYVSITSDAAPPDIEQFGAYIVGSPVTVPQIAQYGLYVSARYDIATQIAQYGVYIVGKVTPLVIPALASNSPETPLQETWLWISDQIVSEDGTEQRISVRSEAKRFFKLKYVFADNAETKEAKRQLYDDFRDNEIAIPLHQYQAVLKAAANAGSSALVFNEARTDLREDGWILIVEGSTYELRYVDTLNPAGCILTAPLTNSYTKRAKVMPVAIGIIDNNGALIQYPKNGSGSITIKGAETAPIVPFIRVSSTAELPTLNDLPILDKRAVGNEFNDVFENGRRTLDWGGAIDSVVPWRFTHFSGDRDFNCQRVLEPADWDYWKVFADYCKGTVNPFYIPTYRDDFDIVEDADALGDQFTVAGHVYSTTYFDNPVFQQIRIASEAGVHYATITDIVPDGDDEILVFDPPLPDGADWEVDQEICLLLRARLGSDEIPLEHHSLHTVINLKIRTIDV